LSDSERIKTVKIDEYQLVFLKNLKL